MVTILNINIYLKQIQVYVERDKNIFETILFTL